MLDDPTLTKALKTMRASVQSLLWEFAVSQKAGTEDKRRLDAMAWAVENFERCLEKMVVEGRLTEEEITRDNKPAQQWATLRDIRYGN